MTSKLEEVRKAAMELSDEERQVLAEEMMLSRFTPEWCEAWEREAERRYARMVSGEEPGLTIEEFFSDDEE